MKISSLWFLLLIGITLFSCKKDKEEPAPTTNVYEGCCDVEAVEFTLDNSHVYIPNIFTPDGDSINDLFVLDMTNIDFVFRFEIFNREGESVFSKINFSAFFDDVTWDGAIDHFGNDVMIGGLYDYEIEFFTIYGQQKTLNGSVCAYICDTTFPEDVNNCLFSTQLKPNGTGFDGEIDALENDCFE